MQLCSCSVSQLCNTYLKLNDQYLLSTDPGIATNVSNTFLVIEQHHQIFNDAGSLLTIPPASPLQAMMVIPDTTGPRLVSFTLDLDSGLLTLQFSELVTDLNAMPSAITLQSASNGTGTSYTLTGGRLQSYATAAVGAQPHILTAYTSRLIAKF